MCAARRAAACCTSLTFACAAVLAQCDHVMCMQALLPSAPANIALVRLRCDDRSRSTRAQGACVPAHACVQILLQQIAQVLRASPEERRSFLSSGGLKMIQVRRVCTRGANGGAVLRTVLPQPRVQTLDADNADMMDLVEAVNGVFPAEVVAFCKPDFMATLAAKTV